METQFKIAGCILIILGLIHVGFPKYFQWKKELQSLSLINKEMFLIHTFFIAFTLILMGMLCLTSSQELTTNLGKKICLGIGVFWIARLLMQFFGYSSILWKGKKFETIVHILFTLLWCYLSTVFLYPVLS